MLTQVGRPPKHWIQAKRFTELYWIMSTARLADRGHSGQRMAPLRPPSSHRSSTAFSAWGAQRASAQLQAITGGQQPRPGRRCAAIHMGACKFSMVVVWHAYFICCLTRLPYCAGAATGQAAAPQAHAHRRSGAHSKKRAGTACGRGPGWQVLNKRYDQTKGLQNQVATCLGLPLCTQRHTPHK